MSTRSHIGVEHFDHSVNYVYCHFDGYLELNGVLLALFYNDYRLADRLVSREMRSLGCYLEGTPDSERLALNSGSRLARFPLWTDYYPVGGSGSAILGNSDDVDDMPSQEYDYVYSHNLRMWFVRCSETGGKFKPLGFVLSQQVTEWPHLLVDYQRLAVRGARSETQNF